MGGLLVQYICSRDAERQIKAKLDALYCNNGCPAWKRCNWFGKGREGAPLNREDARRYGTCCAPLIDQVEKLGISEPKKSKTKLGDVLSLVFVGILILWAMESC